MTGLSVLDLAETKKLLHESTYGGYKQLGDLLKITGDYRSLVRTEALLMRSVEHHGLEVPEGSHLGMYQEAA